MAGIVRDDLLVSGAASMARFVTDRTESDVLLGNSKSRYGYADLNRVEKAVLELSTLAAAAGYHYNLTVKTNWGLPTGDFDASRWPAQSQMTRYLGNVRTLARDFAPDAPLPDTMDGLTWEGANRIEAALETVAERLNGIVTSWPYSGELWAGEEDFL